MSLVSRFREKYLSTTPKPRDLVDSDGQVFSSIDARGAEVSKEINDKMDETITRKIENYEKRLRKEAEKCVLS